MPRTAVIAIGFAGLLFLLPSQAHAFCVNDPPKRICLRGDNQPYIVSPQERAIADRCYDPKFTKKQFQDMARSVEALAQLRKGICSRVCSAIDKDD
jgi:hypothetical protein